MTNQFKVRKWRSIQVKIMLSFILAILIPFIMLSVISYRNYIYTVNEYLIDHNETMNELFAERINDFFSQLDHIYFALHNSNILQTVPRVEKQDFDSVRYFLEMTRTVDSLVVFYGFTGIDTVFVIDESGVVLYQNTSLIPLQNNAAVSSLISEGRLDAGRGISHPYYSDTVSTGAYSGQHIAYFRRTGTMRGVQGRLYVIFEVRVDNIQQILESLRDEANHTLVIAEDEVIISKAGDIQIPDEVVFAGQNMPNPYSERVGSQSVLLTSHPIQGTNWTFTSIRDEAYLFSAAARLRNFTILLTIAVFAFASIAALGISFSLTAPIKKIKAISQRITSGETDIQIPMVSKDEIGELGQCIDNMLQHTRTLLTEKYMMEIKQKEAQLYALQVQINPHFLYNTMEAIRAMATVAGVKSISDVAVDMVDMFRYSMKSTSVPVRLRDEIAHVSCYLNIVKMRHEERLRYELDIDEDTLDCYVERLLLQPLAENAVNHGIEPKRRGGMIQIAAKRAEESLVLIVRDEGVGMCSETLENLRSTLTEYRQNYQSEHIGISNVYGRLFLSYGENFSFEIESRFGEGTTVKITIPLTFSLTA